MPYKPRRGCFHPGCPNLTKIGETYCEFHAAQRQRATDKKRGTSTRRGYDADWQRLRLSYLLAHPKCVMCGQLATLVDHILPLRDGGTNTEDNLQALCDRCHREKTNKYDGGFGNQRREGPSNL